VWQSHKLKILKSKFSSSIKAKKLLHFSHNDEQIEKVTNVMEKGGYVYIITNKNNTVLYTGVTSDLSKRIAEHKETIYKKSFTTKYNLDKLVYFEHFNLIIFAIEREKQIKAGTRKKKLDLINSLNPEWKDLFEDIIHW